MFENVDLMTAIITPFDNNEKIDFSALKKLTEHLLATGSKGFVVGGTTGETPTLTEDEKLELYQKFVEIVDGRVPIVAGAGSNNTAQTIDFIKKISEKGEKSPISADFQNAISQSYYYIYGLMEIL